MYLIDHVAELRVVRPVDLCNKTNIHTQHPKFGKNAVAQTEAGRTNKYKKEAKLKPTEYPRPFSR